MFNKKILFLFILSLVFPLGANANTFALDNTWQLTIAPGLTVDGTKNTIAFVNEAALPPDGSGDPGKIYASGSYFTMGGLENSIRFTLTPLASGGHISIGAYQPFAPTPDEVHITGPNGAGSGYDPIQFTPSTILRHFSFGGSNTFVGTNPVSYQSGQSFPVPSLTIDMDSCTYSVIKPYCNITMDLSSWQVFWNGAIFDQGPRPDNTQPFILAEGVMYIGGAVEIDWMSHIKGGQFNNAMGIWHLEGQLTQVPIPSAVWLFGSGLLGLIGLARKKSKKA